jgi:hypothetical protein
MQHEALFQGRKLHGFDLSQFSVISESLVRCGKGAMRRAVAGQVQRGARCYETRLSSGAGPGASRILSGIDVRSERGVRNLSRQNARRMKRRFSAFGITASKLNIEWI